MKREQYKHKSVFWKVNKASNLIFFKRSSLLTSSALGIELISLKGCTQSLITLESYFSRQSARNSESATLPPGVTAYPLCRRLDEPQGQSGRVRKMSSPPGFDPWSVQAVACRCNICDFPLS